jgi:uncharacterized LabA/DUF88 family protein
MASGNENLAVLIDADNAQASNIQDLLAEVSRYGRATIKRAYGDWTTPHLQKWKASLNEFAIQPIQQFAYTQGKNSTDSALIIDAMDLLYSGNLNGFCLVSSDSDFTRLASRVREAGLSVYGFGERKTPQAFVAACDKFIYTEILKPGQKGSSDGVEPLEPLLKNAVTATQREDGWSTLSSIGSIIAKNSPSFDARNYGFQKLGELVRKQPYLEFKEETGEGSPNAQIFVRIKKTTRRRKKKKQPAE